MSVKVKIQNLEQFKSNLKGYVNQFADKKQQQQVLRPGAVVLRNAAKKLVPKSDKDHYYYRKGKKTKILSGNLQNSMYVYREATGEVSVGPRVLRRIQGLESIGSNPKNSSGYYSHMIYKGATEFRDKITGTALIGNLTKINAAMARAVERVNKRIAKKYGFQ